jgi:predicted Rossmann fold flavoprotein
MPIATMSDTGLDIAVIGGGAAGLAAAIFAAQADTSLRVAVLDGATRLGAKIMVSGGGRCNVTHHQITPADFNGPPSVLRHVLKAFNEKHTLQWFESMGVTLKREPTGKLFPVTDSARTVLDALLHRCRTLGITLLTGCRVHAVTPQTADDGFAIHHQHGCITARRVIMATGGRSLPRTGSDGQGWRIVETLGHRTTPTHPALVPIVLRSDFFHAAISGISHEATLSTFAGGKQVDRRQGSLLWTHFGISGPLAMDASRHWVIAMAEHRSPRLVMNLLAGEAFDTVERWWVDAISKQPKRSLHHALAQRLPAGLAEALLRHLLLDPQTPLHQFPRDSRRKLVAALTQLELPVEGPRGWNYAEVTAGGVPLDEIDHRTMASRKQPGLYLIGEMLDCDGRIGGFNFQWAWSTGHLAGTAAARSLKAR